MKLWIDKYSDCKLQSIQSFIIGIKKDSDIFFNSLKYAYSNGLLEGRVNKLKTIKRSIYDEPVMHYSELKCF